MFEHLHKQLIANAIAESPNEMCGYIVRDESGVFFYKAENVIPHNPKHGTTPTEAFAISIEERAHVESLGEILALVHSHTNSNCSNGKLEFSTIDKAACNRGEIPWILVVLPTEEIKMLMPNADEKVPLLGRPWFYGTFDCYSLIRDAMAEADVHLNDYPRQALDEQLNPQWSLYEDNFEREGFVEVDMFGKLQKFDLLFMQLNSRKVNHAGILWDCDRNIFLHHLVDKISSEEIFGGYFQKCTVKVVRHKSLL